VSVLDITLPILRHGGSTVHHSALDKDC
jgi:hypothetical protein